MNYETKMEIAKLEKLIARRYGWIAVSYDLDVQRHHKSIIAELQEMLTELQDA